MNLAVSHKVHTAERDFLARIIKHLGQTKWRIGEIQNTVGPVNEIVRTVEASFGFKDLSTCRTREPSPTVHSSFPVHSA
jgi:hypothetical protein